MEEAGFEAPPPDHPPFSGGPFLFVALPESLQHLVPLNATALLREWEEMLDPQRAVQLAAIEFIGYEDWLVRDWFTQPSFSTSGLLRPLARDEELIRCFELARGELTHGEKVPLARLVEGDRLFPGALSVVLGLAVGAALLLEAGPAGKWPRQCVSDGNGNYEGRQAAKDREVGRRRMLTTPRAPTCD